MNRSGPVGKWINYLILKELVMKNILLIFTVLLSSCTLSKSPITMEKEEDGLLFLENGQKVLFYQIEPKNYDGKYERCNYVHPLWGLDGNVLTEDFPADHLHHRGIFWAWHQIWINGERIGDAWAIDHFEQRVKDVTFSNIHGGAGVLRTEVEWLSDQWLKSGRKVPYLKENSIITIYLVRNNIRKINFEISLLALEENLTIGGSEDVKGYSGFSVRVILPEDVLFSGPGGIVKPENTAVESPGYINISGSLGSEGRKAGVVIMDNPANPGYPQPWILRNAKSMQNAVFPGNTVVSVPTDKPLVLNYSLLVYSGTTTEEQIKALK